MKSIWYYKLTLKIKYNYIKSRIKSLFCDHSIVECWWSDWPNWSYIAYICKKCMVQSKQYWRSCCTTQR